MSADDEEISRLYQQGKEQGPPEQLDQAILKAAHEAVEEKAPVTAARATFSGGWRVAMPVAAVLVITVILAPFIKQYQSPAPMSGRLEAENRSLMEQKKLNTLLQSAQKTEIKKRSLSKSKAFSDEAAPSFEPMRAMPVTPSSASMSAGESKFRRTESVNSFVSDDELALDSIAPIDEPDVWLKKIRLLLDEGKIDLARNELNRFKLVYPGRKIDQSLLQQFETAR